MMYLLNFTKGKGGEVIGCMLLNTACYEEAIREVESKLDTTDLYMYPYEATPDSIYTKRFEETFGENLFVEVDRVKIAFQDLISEIDAFDV